jgi:hypothetical protein
MWTRRTKGLILFALVIVAVACGFLSMTSRRGMSVTASTSAVAHIQRSPKFAIVFTSRSDTSSLRAEAPESEAYKEPVPVPWAASEGRLRLLDESGRLFELTWGRKLDDGSTIIDVMSPTVSIDGKRILFAGRKSTHDRWRIYQVGVDGSGLKQLTGGPMDAGCIAVPPLRFRADGSRLSDVERKRLDYDDVDPTDLGPNGFAFASSRIPDLGRDHSRRSTQIWCWPRGASAPEPLTANRNNDRWPVLIAGNQIMFSLWSRNREAVTADLSDVRPVSLGGEFVTQPSDHWVGAVVTTNGAQFGYAIKSVEPVWRPRPLFNGRIGFMTSDGTAGSTRLAQADWGHIRTSPSSIANGASLPYEGGAERYFGPSQDAEGRRISAACPSPAPDHTVLFTAAPHDAPPGAYGIYQVADDWSTNPPAPRRIFDDPAYVDAEPVAVYARKFPIEPQPIPPALADAYRYLKQVKLASGEIYDGPMGYLENIAMSTAIRNPIPWHDRSHGEMIDPRANPLVSPPPNVASVAVYSAGRDRFDDPEKPRILGGWEKRLVLPVERKDQLRGWIPSDPLRPSVLVGFDANGKVARWSGTATESRPARTYFAYAGDHYSGVRPNGYHYCNGCHTGHTFTVLDPTERTETSALERLFSVKQEGR